MTPSDKPRRIDGLSEVAGRYEGIILDLWGVVHDGVRPFPDTLETLGELKRSGRVVWLLSNAPRRAHIVAEHLEDMGVSPDLYDGLLTSGEAVWRALEAHPGRWGRRCFHLGAGRDGSVYEDLGLDLVPDVGNADFILNSGVRDFSDTLEEYAPLLEEGAAKGLPMICANPDRIVHVGDRLVLCAGTLAADYEKRGGAVDWFGKPYLGVYETILGAMGTRRVLAVGDSMETDVAGAKNAGIDAALVLSGIHRDEVFLTPDRRPGLNPEGVEALFGRYPLQPDYLLDRFYWKSGRPVSAHAAGN